MPSKLLQRLRRNLDQTTIRPRVMNLEHVERKDVLPADPTKPQVNIRPHWPAGAHGSWGNAMTTIQSIVLHETSGWPHYGGRESFLSVFTCIGAAQKDLGIGPQYFVEPNGTAYTLVGDEDFANAPRTTWHAGWHDQGIDLNPFTLGIENADLGDADVSPGQGTGPHWFALSTQSEDLPGMKAYLLFAPDSARDAVLIWFAKFARVWVLEPPKTPGDKPTWALHDGGVPRGFLGPGDIIDDTPTTAHLRGPKAWRNMLFTERNVRTLVRLVRFLLERNGLPRSFPLLPYVTADQNRTNAAIFRRLLLGEQRRDEIATQMGLRIEDVQQNAPAFLTAFGSHPTATWSRLFGAIPSGGAVTPCFRGVISHAINGGHPCPGPLFDWHRFAHEVWDWWWYPFDRDANGASTARRPYLRARSTTALVEYYWDAVGTAAQYDAMRDGVSVEETFVLPGNAPVYAMANGVIVAAQLGGATPGATGFVLVRHEVFHRAVNEAIDYDQEPTYVWSLVTNVDNAPFAIPDPPPALAAAPAPAGNPTWLDRFIVRLRECELATQFHASHATNANVAQGWARVPDGEGPRVAVGQEIERDAAAYRGIASNLTAGSPVLFPLESSTDTTPVRVALGDFLGLPGAPGGRQGIQVEIFSKTQLPVPNAARRAVSAQATSWWKDVTRAERHESAAEADLPADGAVWHYHMTDFLAWIIDITWKSERRKYGYPAGAELPARPTSRAGI